MIRRACGIAALLAACAAGPKYKDDPVFAARPDTKALVIKTSVKARTVVLVLSARWNPETRITKGVREAGGKAGNVVVRGPATLDLRELHLEASESIEVRFLQDPDHEDLVLHARDVESFRQEVQYGHRLEHVDVVTMANDQVTAINQ